jgi:hypothetical protein
MIRFEATTDTVDTTEPTDPTEPTDTFNADRTPPKIVGISIISKLKIELSFSEKLAPTTVTRDNVILRKDGNIMTGGSIIVDSSGKKATLFLYGNGKDFSLYNGIFRVEFKKEVTDLAGNSISPTSDYTDMIGRVRIDGSDMWADYGIPDSKRWPEAEEFCDNLKLNGYKDWYLPSKSELENAVISISNFGVPSGGLYWTSEQYTGPFPDHTSDTPPTFPPLSSGDPTPVGRTGNFYLSLVVFPSNSEPYVAHQGINNHVRCIRKL